MVATIPRKESKNKGNVNTGLGKRGIEGSFDCPLQTVKGYEVGSSL